MKRKIKRMTEKNMSKKDLREWRNFGCNVKNNVCCHGGNGAIYGLGFIAALIYYLTTATSVWAGLVGIVKAILWPAFVVFGLMKYLGL